MQNLILFHYSMSPFSEKVRSMLGYTGLSWQSVMVPAAPPRPGLLPLTGGYRKIPVAQVGADIFCDTRTITRKIAELSSKPELALENCSEEVRALVSRADGELFLACIASADAKGLFRRMRADHSLWEVAKVLWDRVNVARKAKVKAAGPARAKQLVHSHLKALESQLNNDFLFGSRPNIADFSVYHGLWFIRDMSGSEMINSYPGVITWMDRIKAFGHGSPVNISFQEAWNQAGDSSPSESAEVIDDTPVGKQVRIRPVDYARNPVAGTLVGVSEQEWTVGIDFKGKQLHVHVPREGFSLQTY